MPELSEATKKLIEKHQTWRRKLEEKESAVFIHVDEVALKVAAFYEKLREIIDWEERHLIIMKRSAIERKLKRRLLLAKEKKTIAEPLVLELIRGGHFPNDQIKETKINDVEKILNKYVYILEKSKNQSSEKQKGQLYNWLLSLAACEIEETLSSSNNKEKALIDYMAESMADKIRIQERRIISIGGMSQEEKNRQVYIACQRALFKLDPPIIAYHLLKKKYDQWKDLSPGQLDQISQNIYSIWQNLEKELNHPLKDKFYKICQRYNTPYLLLGDILAEEDSEKAYQKISNPEELEKLIKKAYEKRLFLFKKRLSKAALYSTLSILIANIFAFFTLELPLVGIFGGSFSYPAIAVDILGPTLLIFLLATIIKSPSKNNLEMVLIETMKIVYQTDKADVYEIKILPKKSFAVKFFIALLYLFGALISLAIIATFFRLAGLPLISYPINVAFIALAAFGGLAIRKKGEEFTVEEKKSGFFSFIFDILFLPIISFGCWLSNKWKENNTISLFLNALIDLPFQIFVEFLEQWRYFLKEKKEEIH